MQAAYDLVASATKSQQATVPVPAEEQRRWLAIAARALVQAGWLEAGADLAMALHDFAFARKALSRASAILLHICQPCDLVLEGLSASWPNLPVFVFLAGSTCMPGMLPPCVSLLCDTTTLSMLLFLLHRQLREGGEVRATGGGSEPGGRQRRRGGAVAAAGGAAVPLRPHVRRLPGAADAAPRCRGGYSRQGGADVATLSTCETRYGSIFGNIQCRSDWHWLHGRPGSWKVSEAAACRLSAACCFSGHLPDIQCFCCKVDDMAGVAVTAAMNRGDRKAALTAAERISEPTQRDAILRRYSFFKQLAGVSWEAATDGSWCSSCKQDAQCASAQGYKCAR